MFGLIQVIVHKQTRSPFIVLFEWDTIEYSEIIGYDRIY